jgi:hypothetical protein
LVAALGRDDESVRERRQRSADGLLALASVYEWALSMWLRPARTASCRKAMCSLVFVSRFVPSPIRATSASPILRLFVVFDRSMCTSF